VTLEELFNEAVKHIVVERKEICANCRGKFKVLS
jgi:DnaJ-class molecular chaperone